MMSSVVGDSFVDEVVVDLVMEELGVDVADSADIVAG